MDIHSHLIAAHRRGFSLLELSMVLVISGLMVSFVLQANQSTAPQNDCYVVTKAQLNTIRASVERFARKNDRLPVPAARNVGVEDIKYGREAVTGTAAVVEASANLDLYGTGATAVSYGALPFQALGLSPSFGSDCWGNKFSYAVTTALTNSTGFKDSTVVGNIAVKSSLTITTNAKGAYAVISHGEDGIGAVKTNFSAANPAHAWCTTGTALKHLNCNIVGALADAVFNNGKDAGADYFDDLITVAGKPQVLSSGGNAYCWGLNDYGEIGDGSTSARLNATVVPLPSGVKTFVAIASGGAYRAGYAGVITCALSDTGWPYCWGDNGRGGVGNGTVGGYVKTPTAVSSPGGGVTSFRNLTVGVNNVCAIANNNQVYCWGGNDTGQNGFPGYGNTLVPTQMPRPVGVNSYTAVAAGYLTTMVIGDNGKAYASGLGGTGAGDGTSSHDFRLLPMTLPGDPGVTAFTDAAVGASHSCAIVNTGDAYCWGDNTYGELGIGAHNYVDNPTPAKVVMPVGVKFKHVVATLHSSCALGDDANLYCWGGNWLGGKGQVGNGDNAEHPSPTKVSITAAMITAGATSWLSVWAQPYDLTMCGMANNFQTYCWGGGADGELGNGAAADTNVPMLVKKADGSALYGAASGGRCAVNPPPASWGGNTYGQLGDGTTVKRSTPGWVWPQTQPDNYFTYASGGLYTSCGITDTGAAYCWGWNGGGAVGDGTIISKSAPTKAIFPSGVTAWKAINSTPFNITCAIASGGANDNKAYCWGDNYGGHIASLVNTGCPGNTVSAMSGEMYNMQFLCSSGTAVYGMGSGMGMATGPLPTGTTTIKQIAKVSYLEVCMLADNSVDGAGQVYCMQGNWTGDTYAVAGDGSPNGTSTYDGSNYQYKHVTLPSGVTKFTALATGALGVCALGDDNWVYCWGGANAAGSNAAGYVLVPTAVTAPAGVTKFTSLSGTEFAGGYMKATGNDGNTYVWGLYYGDPDWAAWNVNYLVPTKMPLPPGATAFQGIGFGGIELVR